MTCAGQALDSQALASSAAVGRVSSRRIVVVLLLRCPFVPSLSLPALFSTLHFSLPFSLRSALLCVLLCSAFCSLSVSLHSAGLLCARKHTKSSATMIRAVLIVNNHGKPRLTKFFEHYVTTRTEGGRRKDQRGMA